MVWQADSCLCFDNILRRGKPSGFEICGCLCSPSSTLSNGCWWNQKSNYLWLRLFIKAGFPLSCYRPLVNGYAWGQPMVDCVLCGAVKDALRRCLHGRLTVFEFLSPKLHAEPSSVGLPSRPYAFGHRCSVYRLERVFISRWRGISPVLTPSWSFTAAFSRWAISFASETRVWLWPC